MMHLTKIHACYCKRYKVKERIIMSKELGKDKDGIEKVMTNKDYAGDASGQISMNAINAMTGQMTYFYTSKVGMDATTAGNILLISKIADGISDIIMGRAVDKTNTKDGKARPWLKWMIIPTVIAMILLFTMPHAGTGIQLVYGIATNIFAAAVVYTAIAVPYYTLINYETKSQEERGKIGTYRGFLGYLITQVIGIVLIPFTNLLGGTQSAWIIVAAVFGVIGAIALTICFRTTKERYRDDVNANGEVQEEKATVMEALKVLVRNKYWWMMMLSQTALSGIYTYIYGALAFYCMYVLGNDNLTALVAMIGLIPSILGFVVSPMLIKKFGMRKTGMIAAMFGIVGTIIRLFAPANMVVFILGNCLVTFATAPIVSVLPAMVINCAEWNDYKAGVKLTGMTNSVASFGAKIGSGFAGASLGWVLALGHFDAAKAVQSASAMISIYALNIWIPGILLAIIFVCYALYSLEKKYVDIVKANNERRASGK